MVTVDLSGIYRGRYFFVPCECNKILASLVLALTVIFARVFLEYIWRLAGIWYTYRLDHKPLPNWIWFYIHQDWSAKEILSSIHFFSFWWKTASLASELLLLLACSGSRGSCGSWNKPKQIYFQDRQNTFRAAQNNSGNISTRALTRCAVLPCDLEGHF